MRTLLCLLTLCFCALATAQTPAPTAPIAPVAAVGNVVIDVVWGAVTSDDTKKAITGVTYNVYRGIDKAPFAVVSKGLAFTEFFDQVAAGQTYCWMVTAVAAGLESALPPAVCLPTIAGVPATPQKITVKKVP